MGKEITTWSGLDAYIMESIKFALYEVGEKVNRRMRYFIETDVYNGSNEVYVNTYQFLESISTSDVRLSGNTAEVEVYSDTNKIHADIDRFQHGSRYWDLQDISSVLPEILAYNLSGDFFGSGFWQNRRNYYQDTIDSLNSGGELKKWFIEGLKARGITAK